MAGIKDRENKRHSKESVVAKMISSSDQKSQETKKVTYIQRAYYITQAQADALEWYRFVNKMDLSEIVRSAITAYIGEEKIKEFEESGTDVL